MANLPKRVLLGGLRRESRPMRPARGGCMGRILIMLAMMAFAYIQYRASTHEDFNEITGETQRVALDPQEEIAMGLHAAPQMAQQHGGLHPDQQLQDLIDKIGHQIVLRSDAGKTEYKFEFHLLADQRTVNAFALPGGQVFITHALLSRFKTEDEIAGVLGHEIGHVVARHSAEQIAKAKLTQGLSSAVIMASDGGMGNQQLAGLINKLVNTKYGRDDELQSDELGVRFMVDAGYDPNALIRVMEVLAEASGGGGGPEFMSTHPSPPRRIERIKEWIVKYQK